MGAATRAAVRDALESAARSVASQALAAAGCGAAPAVAALARVRVRIARIAEAASGKVLFRRASDAALEGARGARRLAREADDAGDARLASEALAVEHARIAGDGASDAADVTVVLVDYAVEVPAPAPTASGGEPPLAELAPAHARALHAALAAAALPWPGSLALLPGRAAGLAELAAALLREDAGGGEHAAETPASARPYSAGFVAARATPSLATAHIDPVPVSLASPAAAALSLAPHWLLVTGAALLGLAVLGLAMSAAWLYVCRLSHNRCISSCDGGESDDDDDEGSGPLSSRELCAAGKQLAQSAAAAVRRRRAGVEGASAAVGGSPGQ